ncbi:MAG TPA: AbrB/MazE/SpoVT family DNA-binding domain-containing protein [Acidimicrobiales bacterium]|nr:AbrB/MazE/SpoVT family DNA-binding domain-containing protein [Acidimicrobiales bacterium]
MTDSLVETDQRLTQLRVTSRGQMSLPAAARHRWDLDDGGVVAAVDLGDLVVLVPGGLAAARKALLGGLTAEDWERARSGFGDADLATQ